MRHGSVLSCLSVPSETMAVTVFSSLVSGGSDSPYGEGVEIAIIDSHCDVPDSASPTEPNNCF